MKKKIVLILSAFALTTAMVFTSCAYEVKWVKDTPVEQRADIYLIREKDTDARITKLDGQGLGISGFDREGPSYKGKFWDTYIWGSASATNPNNRIVRAMQVTPGEHTITISGKVLWGRKDINGTYNFQPGKKYMIMLSTQGLLNSMMSPSFAGVLGDLGSHLKDSLAGNYIIILAESKKDEPRFPDGRIDWTNITSADKK